MDTSLLYFPMRNPMLLYVVLLLWGLIAGSFISMLVHRLPIMLGVVEVASDSAQDEDYDLAYPASHCPHCHAPLRWYHNIPLLGFAMQGGRCTHCGQSISRLYPALELGSALLMLLPALRYAPMDAASLGFSVAWGCFFIGLLALMVLDMRYFLLPDCITLSLLWLGLLLAATGWMPNTAYALHTPSLHDAVLGAAASYLVLWLIYWVFKLLTGKEGMGYGDFKLFAACGAWLGWQAMPHFLLLSCLIGIASALLMPSLRLLVRMPLKPSGDETLAYDIPERAIAFGPCIIASAFVFWLWPQLAHLNFA